MPNATDRSLAVVTNLMLGAFLVPATSDMVHSRNDPSALCLQAAQAAADRTGVPYDVLLAVSLVETGRDRGPWPWTVNLGGQGHWLDSAAEAEALVASALERGATNIDIGCFQLNYRWHAEGFASIADMLDPDSNADYAADFLALHFSRTGDWVLAAAAYHSATPEHADRYRARFEATFAMLSDDEPAPVRQIPETRENSFPLLVAGSTGLTGSLVPATSGGRRLIGGP